MTLDQFLQSQAQLHPLNTRLGAHSNGIKVYTTFSSLKLFTKACLVHDTGACFPPLALKVTFNSVLVHFLNIWCNRVHIQKVLCDLLLILHAVFV